MTGLNESHVEGIALDWLKALGHTVLHGHGRDIAASEPDVKRRGPNGRDVLLERRLCQALVRLNPDLPPDALDDANRKLTRVDAPSLVVSDGALAGRAGW